MVGLTQRLLGALISRSTPTPQCGASGRCRAPYAFLQLLWHNYGDSLLDIVNMPNCIHGSITPTCYSRSPTSCDTEETTGLYSIASSKSCNPVVVPAEKLRGARHACFYLKFEVTIQQFRYREMCRMVTFSVDLTFPDGDQGAVPTCHLPVHRCRVPYHHGDFQTLP